MPQGSQVYLRTACRVEVTWDLDSRKHQCLRTNDEIKGNIKRRVLEVKTQNFNKGVCVCGISNAGPILILLGYVNSLSSLFIRTDG